MKEINLKDIKKDQVFYERCYDKMVQFTALENAYESGKMDDKYIQWRCTAKQTGIPRAEGGDITIDFLVTENHEHYGPKLYTKTEIIPNDYPIFEVSKITGDKTELCVVGNLMCEPTVDNALEIIDDEQGIFFRSSKIQNIEIIDSNIRLIKTKNSIYKLEKL